MYDLKLNHKASDLLFETFQRWLRKEGSVVYSDLTLTVVAILFMRRMFGFDPELSGADPSSFPTCHSIRLHCITAI